MVDPLTYEQRRKYDYFFLEAVRLKQKGEYDAAFELYKHCLEIYPKSAATLYEISQFYLALGQEDKSEQALKRRCAWMKITFGIHRTLATYYQRKHDLPKAVAASEDMARLLPLPSGTIDYFLAR